MDPHNNNQTSPPEGLNNEPTSSMSHPEAPLATSLNHPPEPPALDKKKDHQNWKSVVSTLLLLAIAPIIALSITAFAVQSYQVDGQSMETTLQDHDRLIVNKIPRTWARITGHPYLPHRGDIIIFNQANLPDAFSGEEKQLIKRVIGLPGDRVVVSNNTVIIYNKEHPGGFNPDTSVGYTITAKSIPGDVDVTLGDNQLFVSGDNRPNSEDSRYFGPIEANTIVGKLVLRLLPINKTERF